MSLYDQLPTTPGVYIFKDQEDNVLYVGKATNLRSRVASYFTSLTTDRIWVTKMLPLVDKVETIDCQSSYDALILEDKLIKQHQPKYNIKQLDDKTYPFLEMTLGEEFPRAILSRKQDNPKSKYFGPYMNSGEINQTIAFLRKVFGVHTGRSPILPTSRLKKCFYCQLDKNLCPMAGEISQTDYRAKIDHICRLLKNKRVNLGQIIKQELEVASKSEQYEKAAKLRDLIFALEHKQYCTNAELPLTLSSYSNIASDLQRSLGLDEMPKRIEAMDISNHRQIFVGAIITAILGEFDKSEYRKYSIKQSNSQNDFEMIREVSSRRLNDTKRPLPDVLLVDGGLQQLAFAKRAASQTNNEIRVVSIAKKPDRIFFDQRDISSELNPNTIKFLGKLRDEVHRFAIKYSREKQAKKFLG